MLLKYLMTIFLITVVGLCIGILTGLSVSPVINTVLTSLLTFMISIFSLWLGIKPTGNDVSKLFNVKIDILPISFLTIGLTIGCFVGIYIRSHNLLSPSDFDLSATPSEPNSKVTALYSTTGTTCQLIEAYSGETLIRQLRSLDDPRIDIILDNIGEDKPDVIKEVLLTICEEK